MAAPLTIEVKTMMKAETEVVKKSASCDEVFAMCECCGLMEECTMAYMALVREKYEGRWICGLCSAAVKDETDRSHKDINAGEALERHMLFCGQFRSSSPPANPSQDFISAMKNLFRRSLDSPRRKKATVFPST